MRAQRINAYTTPFLAAGRSRFWLPLMVLLFAFSRPALADTLYTYVGGDMAGLTGNPPFTTSSQVIVSFTLPGPIICLTACSVSPIAFNITTTVGGVGSPFASFLIQTNSLGVIVGWDIRACDNPPPGCEDFISTTTSGDEAIIGQSFAFGPPGAWTITTVPEPATFTMIGSGVALLGGLVRRCRKNPDA